MRLRVLLAAGLIALLAACGGETAVPAGEATPPSTEPVEEIETEAPAGLSAGETRITIDGQADDWAVREVVLDDPAGDAEEGYLDLTTGYAFVNQNALYFLVETVDPTAPFVHFDMAFQVDDRLLLISWKPGDPSGYMADVTSGHQPIGPAENSSFALGAALEGRVDLRDLGSPESARLFEIRVMVGECCEEPAWRAADTFQPGATPVVNESDSPHLVSDEPEYVLARRFHLLGGYLAERLFAPPAPELTGIARSLDGTIFLQHGGLSAGVSILDVDTGEVMPILDLPPEGAGYGSFVGGPGSTVFVPVGDEIWQVSSDGSYEVWGQVVEGWPGVYTSYGRLLGRSNGETRVLELHPNGTASEAAGGFVQIYDMVAREDGTLFVSDTETGNITRVDPDGAQRTLAEHVLFRDPLDLALDPDGNLYLNSVASGFVRIDTESGAFTPYEIGHNPCTIHQADFEFAGPGRVLFIDPTWSTVTWADLDTGEQGLFVGNEGANTWAAAIGPDDALYVGAWGCGDDIPAQVVRITDDGTREVFVDGLQGAVDDIAFGPDGTLYIATSDHARGIFGVYYVPAGGGDPVQIPGFQGAGSLTVDPLSGNLLASQGTTIYELTQSGPIASYSVAVPMESPDYTLAAAPDGTVYAYAVEAERFWTGPEVERWVLRLDLVSGTSEIVFQYDRQGCCVMGNLSADPQGVLWWVVDPEFIIYRVTPDGEGTLFAQNLPIDPAAAVADSAGDVYFTSPAGIYRIYPEP